VLEASRPDRNPWTVLCLPGLPTAFSDRGTLDFADLEPWILIGNPASRRGYPRLPGVRAEIDELGRLYPDATVLAEPGGDRDVVLEALAESRPMHFALHLVDTGECELARMSPFGLELPDGSVLCASRVADASTRTPLVVLSACATAEGRAVDSEGLLGLGRAFLEAGTRNALVTLWPVEDSAARRFSTHFHRALAGGALPSHAAHAARRALAGEGFEARDWGAFRLLGRD